MKTCILWLRQDLRLSDNPALVEAVKAGYQVVPIYILASSEESPWEFGEASRVWLHHSLKALADELKKIGLKLILKKSKSTQKTLTEIVKETKAEAIYWNRRYEPSVIKRDRKIKGFFKGEGLDVQSFKGSLLFEPWEIKNKQGNPYKVFTPFYNECLSKNLSFEVLNIPKKIEGPKKWPKSTPLKELELEPEIKWDAGILESWEFGEKAALKSLKSFLKESSGGYDKDRDYPAISGTSKMSPYLHFGELSPRQIWNLASKNSSKNKPYLRQIIWREFSFHLLYHFPTTPEQPLYEKFENFPWKKNKEHLQAWQKGMTGYPIVDAGMRELWHTGWMHNRVRMVVGSFLVKHLLISWTEGASWFWDTLVDADLANNTMGWQWIGGCGADAAPYFRIFNPMTQSEKFDGEGKYIRKWVPEIAGLSNKVIHKPWEASEEELSSAGITLGKDYPEPIVDHELARRKALEAYEKIKT